MKIHEELSHIVLQQNFLLATIAVLAIFGTMLEIISLVWDSSSHITQDTDEFWRIHHIAVYSGAGMIAISAFIGLKFLIKRHPNNKMRNGIKLIIIGTGVSAFFRLYGLDLTLLLWNRWKDFNHSYIWT